jgi:thioredoxin-related protein
MENLNKRLELFANIAIILVAVMLVGVVGYRFLSSNKAPAIEKIEIGSNFTMQNVNWVENKKTLVLVLQKGCHFCSESSSFYKTLVAKNQNKVKLLAAFPHSVDEGKNYLKEEGITIDEVRQFDFGGGINGTPTLVLINEKGQVTDSWIGKLLPEDEEKVLRAIACNEKDKCV